MDEQNTIQPISTELNYNTDLYQYNKGAKVKFGSLRKLQEQISAYKHLVDLDETPASERAEGSSTAYTQESIDAGLNTQVKYQSLSNEIKDQLLRTFFSKIGGGALGSQDLDDMDPEDRVDMLKIIEQDKSTLWSFLYLQKTRSPQNG